MFGSFWGNILGTIYFVLFQLVGMMLIYITVKKEKMVVKLVLGSVMGSVLLHWIPVIWSFFFDFTIASHVAALITILPVYVLFFVKCIAYSNINKTVSDLNRALNSIKRHKVFGFILLGFFVLWCVLLYTHSIRLGKDGAIYTGQCTYGDMNMHLGFITSIAVQGTFPPDYSIFPGTKLAYPFLSDSISSSIYVLGASLRWAYILPMLTAFLQVMCGVYMLAYSFTTKISKSVLAIIFYFFNGGLGIFYFLSWSYEPKYRFADIFTEFYKTPTNLTVENIRWVNVIADMLLPQRATLFGYAILFPTIYILYKAVSKNKQSYYVLAALFAGALPLIHTHSFLSIGLISASFLLMQLYGLVNREEWGIKGWHLILAFVGFMIIIQILIKYGMLEESRLMPMAISLFALLVIYGIYLIFIYVSKNGYRNLVFTWGIFVLIVCILAIPQLVGFTFGQVSEGGFVRGCFNWGNQGEFYPWFYIKNMGIVLILGLAAFCGANHKMIRFAFPIIPIWFLAEMIAFAPNNYDNNKLLYVAYLFIVIIASDYSIDIYEKLKGTKGINVLMGFVLVMATISGVLTLGREVVSKLQLYADDQVELAKWIEERTFEDAVVLTNNRHNNSIASLTGRNIVCGSGSFLNLHGINTSERNEDVRKIYENPVANMDLLKKYNVSYICYSPYEWGEYNTDVSLFDDNFEKVFDYGNTKLYKVSAN